MQTRVRTIVQSVIMLIFVAAAAQAQTLEGKVIERRLANGLTVLLYERHQAPIVSCRIYVNAGSANDQLGQTGVAHITEHIAFKGTETIGTTNYAAEKVALEQLDAVWQQILAEQDRGDQADEAKLAALRAEFARLEATAGQYVVSEAYSKIIEEHGGVDLNASTSRDETQYFVSLPSNQLELWMFLEADRLAHLVPREFYKEREVVLEERQMRTDAAPMGTLIEQFVGTAFIAHPYGFPGIGWASDIENISAQQLRDFFQTYYAPSNMTVAIVGDFQSDEALRLTEKYFGQLPSGAPAPRIRTVEPQQPGERRVEVEWDANPYILIGYHRPAATDEDDLVFDVISFLLSSGRTSRLQKHLVEEEQFAIQVDTIATFPGQKYPTLFVIFGVPQAPHSAAELELEILAEIEDLQHELVSAEELEKVVNNVEAMFIDSLSSNSGLAAQLAFAHNVLGDWRVLEQQVARIKTITPEDVMRVAKTYFTPENRTVATLVRVQASPSETMQEE